MAMNNDDTESFCNPACNMDIADYLEIYSDDDDNSDGRIDQFEPYVDTEFQACNVLARLGEDGDTLLGTLGMEHIFKKISEHLDQTLPPGYSYKITGHPSLMVQSAGYIVDGQINSLLLVKLNLFRANDFRSKTSSSLVFHSQAVQKELLVQYPFQVFKGSTI